MLKKHLHWKNIVIWSLVGYSLWFANSSLIQTIHTLHMMNVGEQLLGAIKDMERGQRGYMLTNDPAYLQAYTTGQTTLSIRYEQMSSMLKVQADEVYLVQLGKLLQEKQAEMSQTITLHDAGNQNAAVALVQSGQGRREMDEITHYISLIEENEKSRDWRFIGLLIGCLPLLGFGRTHY